MKKLLMTTTTILAFGSQGIAGNLVFEAPVEQEVIVEEEPMGGSSAWWIVPLIAAIAIGVAVSDDDDDGDDNEPQVSDIRLKTDITWVGETASGLPLYTFSYRGDDAVYQGVMAQDVLSHTPEAIVTGADGVMRVDYAMIDAEMRRLD